MVVNYDSHISNHVDTQQIVTRVINLKMMRTIDEENMNPWAHQITPTLDAYKIVLKYTHIFHMMNRQRDRPRSMYHLTFVVQIIYLLTRVLPPCIHLFLNSQINASQNTIFLWMWFYHCFIEVPFFQYHFVSTASPLNVCRGKTTHTCCWWGEG